MITACGPPHHRQAFAYNSRNKELADGRSGLTLLFHDRMAEVQSHKTTPLSARSQKGHGSVYNARIRSAGAEDVYSSCGGGAIMGR